MFCSCLRELGRGHKYLRPYIFFKRPDVVVLCMFSGNTIACSCSMSTTGAPSKALKVRPLASKHYQLRHSCLLPNSLIYLPCLNDITSLTNDRNLSLHCSWSWTHKPLYRRGRIFRVTAAETVSLLEETRGSKNVCRMFLITRTPRIFIQQRPVLQSLAHSVKLILIASLE